MDSVEGRRDKSGEIILLHNVYMNYTHNQRSFETYRQVSNISHTLVGNKIVYHSDVVGTSPVGAAPTTSSFST